MTTIRIAALGTTQTMPEFPWDEAPV